MDRELMKLARYWATLEIERDDLQEQQQEAARPLEEAAHARLEIQQRMRRVGQWPRLSEVMGRRRDRPPL